MLCRSSCEVTLIEIKISTFRTLAGITELRYFFVSVRVLDDKLMRVVFLKNSYMEVNLHNNNCRVLYVDFTGFKV